jgi:hypothetical protein
MLRATFHFLLSAVWNKFIATVTGAILGALVGFMWEDIDGWVRYLVQPGNMGGSYVMKSWVFNDKHEQIPTVYKASLKQAGTRLFGTIEGKTRRWMFTGYSRSKYVVFAYGGVEQDQIGAGTYAMQKDLNDIIWGHVTQVECIGLEPMYTRCPAIMHRLGRNEAEERYATFMSGACEKVVIKRPEIAAAQETCADLKRKTAEVAH